MKRHVIIGAVFALAIAACGSASNPTATSTTEAPNTTTTTQLATTTTSTTVPETSPEDQAAITLVYEIVFSSETDYAEKAPYIDDPSGLEQTVADYQTTGESMGGVSLVPSEISVDGDTATVIYDLLFGGTPTYPDLTGDAIRVDGAWKITRTMFCSMMASARVGCPSP